MIVKRLACAGNISSCRRSGGKKGYGERAGLSIGVSGMVSTYDVRADLLAGDLVVDNHLEGLGM